MKNILYYIITLIVGIAIGFFIRKCEKENIQVPIVITVPVPQLIGNFKPIAPKPLPPINNIIEINNKLVEEYKKANDSLKKVLFENAVTIHRYTEKFEDTVQTIIVNAKTTGTLDSLNVSYKTKPFKIKIDTIIQIKVPAPKRSLNIYGETGVIFKSPLDNTPVLKGGIDIQNRKNWIYGASYDTDKRIWLKLGKGFKF